MDEFFPNVVAIVYLQAVKQLTADMEARIKLNLEKGFQNQLSCRRTDGSFSSFGNNDPSGSTWFTAFNIKYLQEASKFILIDQNVITAGLNFLQSNQKPDGSFNEPGTVYYKSIQGGASSELAISAYILITFLENPATAQTYKTTITNALSYIDSNINKLVDNYSIAIVAYALQLAKHPKAVVVLNMLKARATKKDAMMYWEKPLEDMYSIWFYLQSTNALNIEMSAYALQALLLAGENSDAFLVMKWLITQRNQHGRFQTTQDTIIALQALAKIAQGIYDPKSTMDLSVTSNSGLSTTISVKPANFFVLQKFTLPSEERTFAVKASGSGFAVIQIPYQFNVAENLESPRFKIEPTLAPDSTKAILKLQVCANFIPDAKAISSNMAVMEVKFPSGFTFDLDSVKDVEAVERVKVSLHLAIRQKVTQKSISES